MEKLSERKSVKALVKNIREQLENENPTIGEIFENCFLNTLKTTIQQKDDGTTFVITGDIPAMWLRDSACQVRPYLVLAKEDAAISDMILGVIRRQTDCILIDPYANAFNEEANGNCWDHDKTDMKPELWERKYEIDSLCFPIQLAYLYWKNTGETKQFDERFLEAVKVIIRTFKTEQRHESQSPYRFERENCIYTDTLSRDGKGALVREDIGLIWSGFRPSDDACVYGYLIPSNMFASVVLKYISEIAQEVYHDEKLSMEAELFSKEIRKAIETYAIVPGGDRFEDFYAYEVDGYGQFLVMDDANVPSLLSAPYLGYCDVEDERYQHTKQMILSEYNPYYYEGTCAKGIGSPHTPARYVWHISMGMEGLTAVSREEKREVLERMISIDAGTRRMHEGIDVNDPSNYTREWFSWANAIFSELVLDYCGYKIVT